jgi:hypothetical protein
MVFGIFRRLGARKEQPTVSANFDAAGMVFNDGRSAIKLSWSEIRRVVALTRSSNIGYTNCILVESRNATVVEVNERMQFWESFLTNLERYLRCSISRAQWETRLVADPASNIVLYESEN